MVTFPNLNEKKNSEIYVDMVLMENHGLYGKSSRQGGVWMDR